MFRRKTATGHFLGHVMMKGGKGEEEEGIVKIQEEGGREEGECS